MSRSRFRRNLERQTVVLEIVIIVRNIARELYPRSVTFPKVQLSSQRNYAIKIASKTFQLIHEAFCLQKSKNSKRKGGEQRTSS